MVLWVALDVCDAGGIAGMGVFCILRMMVEGVVALCDMGADLLLHVEAEQVAMMMVRKYADYLHEQADSKQ